jgi:hypothetical protein
MSRLKAAMTAVAIGCAVLFGGAATASAQDNTVPFTKKLAITGKNKGKDFKGTYTIKRFESRGGKLVAVGTLSGKLKHRKVTRRNVRIPATLTQANQSTASQLPPNPTPGACQILDLVLNPIDLNLLGLHVATSRIEALIEAVPGANALVGNLLCAITGLLDQNALAGAINNLAAALNAILALVPTGPATGAAAVAGPR